MAITSSGFSGGITEASWAVLATHVGSPYSVGGHNDFLPETNTTADRTIKIGTGVAYGHGVTAVNDAQANIQLGVVGSGTRWDLVALRRNWTANTTTVVAIVGTDVKQIPAGRNATPGSLDDQPIALVQITAGQSLPTQVIDLRALPSKVVTCNDLLALPSPIVGSEAVVVSRTTAPDSRWRYQLDTTGNPGWVQDTSGVAPRTVSPSVGAAVIVTATGWTASSLITEATRVGNVINYYQELRTSANVTPDANGGLTDELVGTLNANFVPARPITFPFYYRSTSSTSYAGVGTINSAGTITLISAMPNMPIILQAAGVWSIWFNVTYLVRS